MKTSIVLCLCLLCALAGCKQSANNGNTQSGNSSNSSNSSLGNTNSKAPVTSNKQTKIPYESGPLLGKWKDMEKGVDLTMDFKTDGTYTNVYDGNETQHRYSYLSDSLIESTSPKGVTKTAKLSVKGSEMTLTWTDSSGDAAPQHFERVTKK